MKENWEPYDPEWLIDLAKEQLPDRPEIILALSSCIRAKHSGKAYIYFVSSDSPNQPGSEWQFKENIRLEHKERGKPAMSWVGGRGERPFFYESTAHNDKRKRTYRSTYSTLS